MTYSLQGRVAVITGGSRGLGLAMARLLASHGARVLIAGRDGDAARASAERLTAEGLDVEAFACDVTRRDQVLALRDAAVKPTGTLDIWINNAAVVGDYGPTDRVDEASFLAATDTIIRGTYYGSLAALDVMVRQGHGDLVNLLGRADDGTAAPFQAAYGAAKSWVRGFTATLASEHKGSQVRIHAFNPGLVRTDMLGRIRVVEGHDPQLQRMTNVFTALAISPERAALPLLTLLGQDRREYRAASAGILLRRAAGNLIDRWRGRFPGRLQITTEDVPARPSSVSD